MLGLDNEEHTSESLTSRIEAEKRIQYGAERFLESLDLDTSSIPSASRPSLREKVLAELDVSRRKIRLYQTTIEGLHIRNIDTAQQPVEASYKSSEYLTASSNDAETRLLDLRSEARIKALNLSRQIYSNDVDSEHLKTLERPFLSRSASKNILPEAIQSQNNTIMSSTDHNLEPQLIIQAQNVLDRLSTTCTESISNNDQFDLATLSRMTKSSPIVRTALSWTDLINSTFRFLEEPSPSYMKAGCYRLYRYMLSSREFWQTLQSRGIEWILLRTFAKANRQIPEAEEAIKLMRAVISLLPVEQSPSSPERDIKHSSLSEPLVRVLVSIAENVDDSFRGIALQTLAELAVIDVHTLVEADGYRFLLQAYDFEPSPVLKALTPSLLLSMDSPVNRAALSFDMGIDILFSGLLNAYGTGTEHSTQLEASACNVLVLLRS